MQAVDHPYLVVHSTTGANGGVGAGSEADAVKALGAGGGDRGVCAICHDPVEVRRTFRLALDSSLDIFWKQKAGFAACRVRQGLLCARAHVAIRGCYSMH